MSDNLWNSVVFASHFDGTDTSTTFVDAKNGRTMTAAGGAQLRTAQYKFGTASLYVDGSGDGVSLASHADWTFGMGEFCAEAHVRLTALPGALAAIMGTYNGATGGWAFSVGTSATTLQFRNADSTVVNVTLSAALTTNTWYHLAVARNGNLIRFFVDGVQEGGDISFSPNISYTNSLYIGAMGSSYPSSCINAHLGELRITKGFARYTAAFTPPTAEFDSTAPDPAVLTADITAPALTAAGYGGIRSETTLTALYGAGYGAINSSPSLPAFTAAAYGGMNADLSLPALTVAAYGAPIGDVILPAFQVFAYGHDSTGENAAALALPSMTLSAQGGANANLTLPAFTLDIASTVTNWGTARMTLPALTLAATGTTAGVMSAALTLPRATLVGYGGAVCSITLSSGFTVEATGTSGATGEASVTLPMFELTASATTESYFNGEALLPAMGIGATAVAYLIAPGFTLTAIGTAVVAATYEAYAINLNHTPRGNEAPVDEVTRYTNFPFTHIVRYQNSYFGVNSTGLYLLEGTTDYASPTPTAIPWAFKTAQTDFKDTKQKTVGAAYFGGRLGPASTITLYAGEGAGVAYNHTTPRGALAQNYRQVFGKGVKARYYSLGAAGSGTLELDGIEFDIHTLTRRI